VAQDKVAIWIGYVLGFGLACAYWPQAYADAEVARWAVAWIGIGLLLWWRISFTLPLLGCVFLGIVFGSIFWAPISLDAIWELTHWVLLIGCFVVGVSELEEPVFEGAAWGIAVNSALATAQYLGWHPVSEASTPAGFMGNKDFLSETAILVMLFMLARGRWKMAILALPALVLPQGRAALAAGAVGLTFIGKKWAWATAAALFSVALVFYYMKGSGWDDVRWQIWYATLRGTTFFGHGVGQFYSGYMALQDFSHDWRPEHAHNDWLEILFEFGPIGLLLSAAFAVQLLYRGRGGAVWAGFIVLGLLSFSLHNPATAVLGFLAGGRLYGAGLMVQHREPLSAIRDLARDARRRLFGDSKRGDVVAVRSAYAQGDHRVAVVSCRAGFAGGQIDGMVREIRSL
jgi:O-Antigen ligase